MMQTAKNQMVLEQSGKFFNQGNVDRSEVMGTTEWLNKYFPVVAATALPLDSKLFKHTPNTKRQQIFSLGLRKALKSGIPDFRAQVMDPSIDQNGNICYRAGLRPAVNQSPIWFKEAFEKFMPNMNSRMGTYAQRLILMGLVLRHLVYKQEVPVHTAWHLVCDKSNCLGHYLDSMESTQGILQSTGQCKVGKFYDLANTSKITLSEGTYTVFKGNAFLQSEICPLTYFERVHHPNEKMPKATGWCVMDIAPTVKI